MKSLAMPVLYVFSIVLAVGIGMGQAGKISADQIGGSPDCNYRTSDSPNCTEIEANESDATCPGTFDTFYANPGVKNTGLFKIRENAEFCSSCTMPAALSYDAGSCD